MIRCRLGRFFGAPLDKRAALLAMLLLAGAALSFTRPVEARGATAAPSDTLRLTLRDAVARALENSPRLETAAATQRGADAAWRGARAAGLPSLDLTAGYTRYSDVPALVLPLPTGRPLAISPNIPDAWRARATASMPLFTGGRLAGAITAARGERDAAGEDTEAARADLLLETTAAYWNLGLQRRAASVLREALRAYESHLQDAGERATVGLAARNEVLAVEVELDRAELSRVQADGAAAVAEENLRRMLGVDGSFAIEPADDPAVAAAGATVGGTLRPDQSSRVDSLIAAALASRPERAALAARIAAADARARAESGARWPQLAAVAGYDYANPNRRFFPPEEKWQDSWDASVNVSLPLFDSGRISAATARARALADALHQQAIDFDRRIRLEVTTRVIECRTAETVVTVAERAVDSARESEKVTRDRYREGVASSSDLLDAETKSLRAELDRTDALARLLLARANLDRAMGKRP